MYGEEKMLDLIETELTRVRRMAERADDDFLLYLVDMAIIEANSRARFRRDAAEVAELAESERGARDMTPKLRVVV
jgi:hypothetical protein